MALKGEDRFHSEIRIEACGDVTSLNLLSSREAVSRLEAAIESMSPRNRRSFLHGYVLAVATPLSELLHFVVNKADLLGLEPDEQTYDWLNHRMPSPGESLVSAISHHSSELARICLAFDDLRAGLRQSSGDLGKTVEAIERCRDFAKIWEQLFVEATVVSIDTGERPGDGHLPLSLCLAERVLDYAGRLRSAMALAYSWVWLNGRSHSPVDDDFVIESETHLFDVQILPRPSRIPDEWMGGFWFGINLILDLEGVSLATRPEPDYAGETWTEWYSELDSRVRQSTQDGSWPTHKFGLTGLPQTAVRKMLSQLEVDVATVPPKERLGATLGPDEVHLMSDASAANAIELDIWLGGAVARSESAKVRVLVLEHSVRADSRKWVSVAYRLPIYGAFSNLSKWYLFYKLYHQGDVFDSDVARNITAVNALLTRFRPNIELEKISGLDSEDILQFCVPAAYRAMRDSSREAVDVNGKLRAGISELLAGFWMTSQGYRSIRISFKHASLGKYEYDAIGVKDGQCLVVEVKGADLLDNELQRELSKLEEKVRHLRNRLPALATALGCDGKIDDVSGLFVFLGDLGGFTSTDTQVTLWGFNDFISSLKEADIPRRIVSLLDRSNIIHTVNLGEFPADLFFAGLGED